MTDNPKRRAKRFYIKERINPQTGTYYVACGELSNTKARAMEYTIYGENIMHGFDTEIAYNARLDELRKSGERVQ